MSPWVVIGWVLLVPVAAVVGCATVVFVRAFFVNNSRNMREHLRTRFPNEESPLHVPEEWTK